MVSEINIYPVVKGKWSDVGKFSTVNNESYWARGFKRICSNGAIRECAFFSFGERLKKYAK